MAWQLITGLSAVGNCMQVMHFEPDILEVGDVGEEESKDQFFGNFKGIVALFVVRIVSFFNRLLFCTFFFFFRATLCFICV